MPELDNNTLKTGFWSNASADFPAGFVVFLVALPLCLGVALASGAPLFAGVIAGIIGGLVMGFLSGSPLGVSGPAAGLAAIVLTSIEQLGTFEAFLLAVIISGIFQLILGLLQAGIVAYFFPSSVIKGMLAAIGIIIALKQLPHAVGYDNSLEGNISFMAHYGDNMFTEILHMFQRFSTGAIIISVVSLALLILWELPFFRKKKMFTIINGPLVVVLFGIILGGIFRNMPSMALANEHFVNLPVISGFNEITSLFTFADFSQITNPEIYKIAFTIAVIGSIESLLSVEAADKLDIFKRVTPTNRELRAQGIGNILSGLIGGLPITQVIVRSSANIQSGGRSRLATIFHGFLLLVSVMLIPGILNMVPLASLSVILFLIGLKLAKPVLFKSMYKLGLYQFIPFIVTFIVIIFTDLLIGITVGMLFAIFNILLTNYRTPFIFETKHKNKKALTIRLSEKVSFLNKGGLLQALDQVKPGCKVIIDAQNSISIDYDVIEVIEDFKEKAKYKNIDLEILGLSYRTPKKSIMSAICVTLALKMVIYDM